MRRSSMVLFLAGALFLPLLASPAVACGIVIPPVLSENAAIDAQRALLVWRGIKLETHLQLRAVSDSGTLAWLVPVNGMPEVAEGDNALFEALDSLTAPSIALPQGSAGGVCAGDSGLAERVSVANHLGSGTAGVFEYDVIGGSAIGVTNWLNGAEYPVPDDLETLIEPYVAQGLVFLAVKVTEARDLAALPPLKVTTASPGDRRARFPLGLSATTSSPITPIVWYVLAEKRFRIANAASVELTFVGDALRTRLNAGESTLYADAVDALTEDAGGRLVVTEFAQSLRTFDDLPAVVSAELGDDIFYLTRLFARVPRAAMDDVIITFANEAPDVSPSVIAATSSTRTAATGLLLLLGLFSGQWLMRRRR